MADDFEDRANPAAAADPARHAALSGESEEARAYLRAQTVLAQLQRDNLVEQNAFELSHLRFRRFADWGKAALEIGIALILLLVAVAFGAMVWSAYDSGGLVIEPFSVPPDLAARGLTSEVVAAKLLDQLSQMQGETVSRRAPQSFQNYWGQDIKVTIPDTGISLSELEKYLDLKLGHATRVSGEVIRTTTGIAMTVRAGTNGSATVDGSENALDRLTHDLAEQVYRLTQPYLYGVWLQANNRTKDALAVFIALATNGPVEERGYGFLGWSNCVEGTEGEEERLPILRRAVEADPHLFLPRQNIAFAEDALSRPAESIADARKALPLLDAPGRGGIRDSAAPYSRARLLSFIDANSGDYHSAAARLVEGFDPRNYAVSIFSVEALIARSFAGEHDLKRARTAADMRTHAVRTNVNVSIREMDDFVAQGVMASQAEDWKRVMALGARSSTTVSKQRELRGFARARIVPLVAYAHARLGDFRAANALIVQTPDHCDVCLRMRAKIAELEGEHARAEWWFRRAIAEEPSIPFAYSDWGAALLTRGKLDGAIAKFATAHEKGPHFADPLEMWGEALILKNRSDLALAKFEEANKYAPHWGRLHLKWGDALSYSGDHAGAQNQFATASHLDLTPSEKLAVEHWIKHG